MELISSYKKKIRKYYGLKTIVKQGFWFVDVPRTSSTSIRVELTKHFGITNGKKRVIEQEHKVKNIFKSHMTDQKMQEFLGSKNWNDLFTFSFVRNSWDWIYSMFCYRQKTNIIPDSWTFEDYILQLEGATAETEYFQHHVFRFGASDYIYDEAGNCMVDLVAKFEQRQEGVQQIAERLKIEGFGELFLQRAKPETDHYSHHYNDRMREIIATKYAKDIENFSYSFEQA